LPNARPKAKFIEKLSQNHLNATINIESIEIYSVLGTLIKKLAIGRRNMQIDISELTKGAYILRVTKAKQAGAYKLIKN